MNFINKEHEHFFEECSQPYPDRERQAAFYVLGLSSRLIQHINDLVDSDGIFNTEFNWSWMTEHDQQLYLYALNLYNGFVDERTAYRSTPKYLFRNFGNTIDYLYYAMKLLES